MNQARNISSAPHESPEILHIAVEVGIGSAFYGM